MSETPLADLPNDEAIARVIVKFAEAVALFDFNYAERAARTAFALEMLDEALDAP